MKVDGPKKETGRPSKVRWLPKKMKVDGPQKSVHFNPGPSTFRWTVHFPLFGTSTFPPTRKKYDVANT